MRYTYLKKEFPAGNPIANLFVIIAGVLVIGFAVVLGFFAFVALSAIVLVSAAVIGIRVWWLKRRLQAQAGAGAQGDVGGTQGSVEIIEGEFRVVSDERDET